MDKDMTETKEKMRAVLEQLKNMVSGIDYVEHQLIAAANSKEQADHIAELYTMTLLYYENGYAVYTTELTVPEVITRALNSTDNELPPVYPNYISRMQMN